MITANNIIQIFILYVKWDYYFPKTSYDIFEFYKGKKFILDEDYLYFYSKQDLKYESKNVGSVKEGLMMYRLPIDNRIFTVLKNAKSIDDLRLLYDKKTIDSFLKKYKYLAANHIPYRILSGETNLDVELQNSIINENYEYAAVIRDTINMDILKPLFQTVEW